MYFGGAFCKIGNHNKEYNDNPDIYFGASSEIDTDDRITDIDGEAYQILYKSFKGSTILINDLDGKESIKIIDAAGQQIIMENDDLVALPRRGKETNPPSTASISIITNGDLNLKSNNLKIETNNKSYKFIEEFKGDGVKTDFEFTHNLGSIGIVQLFLNNTLVNNSNITLTETTCNIIFSSAPLSNDKFTLVILT